MYKTQYHTTITWVLTIVKRVLVRVHVFKQYTVYVKKMTLIKKKEHK